MASAFPMANIDGLRKMGGGASKLETGNKVTAMKYAEICNKYYVNFPELKFQIKNEGFRGGNDEQFTADMLEFLSGDLTGETLPSKANAIPWDYAGEIKLQPIKKDVKSVASVAKELPAMLKSLERCVSSDMLRPAMTYVYSTGEKLVATDGHKLIAVNFPAEQGFYYTPKAIAKNRKPWKGVEGELKGPGFEVGVVDNATNVRYPDFTAVWPSYTGDYGAYRYIDTAKLLSMALAADRARRFFVPGTDTGYLAMLLTWGEKRAYFDNKILADLLTTLLEQGETFLKLRMSAPNRCIVLEGSSASGIVSPVMWDKEDRPYVRIDLCA